MFPGSHCTPVNLANANTDSQIIGIRGPISIIFSHFLVIFPSILHRFTTQFVPFLREKPYITLSEVLMSTARSILVIEDERDLADMLAYNLKRAGHNAQICHDGQQGLALARSSSPDLILLDLMLPGLPGLEVARSLRASPETTNIPIIMLTAKAEEADQIAGLGAGADDYVVKPFSTKLLLARIDALLRRTTPSVETFPPITVGAITLDPTGHTLHSDGQSVTLTLTEFKILAALLACSKRVLSRNELIAKVMGPGIIVTARTIDVHIASIRRKLGNPGGQIRTIRGVGYQLTPEIHAHAEAD